MTTSGRIYADDDPLAELARLVNEDNPFTRLDNFDKPKKPPAQEERREPVMRAPFTAPPETALADDAIVDEAESEAAPAPYDWDEQEDRETEDDRSALDESRVDATAESGLRAEVDDKRIEPSLMRHIDETTELLQRQLEAELSLGAAEETETRGRHGAGTARRDPVAADTRAKAGFGPVLESPGHPDFKPTVGPEETEPRVERAETVRNARPEGRKEPAFEMPVDLSASGAARSPRETDLEGLVAGVAAAAAGHAASQKSAHKSAMADAPQDADEDPFAVLENALKAEVDAALKAGDRQQAEAAAAAAVAADASGEDDGLADDEAEESGGKRGLLIAASVLGLVVLGGLGALGYMGLVGDAPEGGEPALITASEDPLKERPQDPGGATVENVDSPIFTETTREGSIDAQPQIVSREEPVAQIPGSEKADDRIGEAAALGEGNRDNPRVITPAPLQPGASGEEPRRVRTMIVKPDGTIVRATEDGTEAEVAVTPVVPAPTGGGTDTQTAAVDTTAASTIGEQAVDAAPTVETATPLSELGPEDPSIPVPLPRPANLSPDASASAAPDAQTAVPTQEQASPASAPAPADAPAQTQAATQAAPAAAPVPGAYSVQLASRRSQEQALTTFATMQSEYPSILANYQPFIERADLGTRGVFYRLRVGPLGNQANAEQLCSQLRQAGLSDCLVRRN